MFFISSYISFPNLGLEFNIGRTAFTIFGLDMYFYTIIVGCGFFLAFFYALRRTPQFGMTSDKVFDTVFCGFIGSFIGARTYYITFSENDFSSFFSVINFRGGGLAIYGGIIGSVIFALVYMKLKKIKILPVLDLAGLGFLLGIGVGRWGNFFNQEAYGAVTSSEYILGMTGSRIAREISDFPSLSSYTDLSPKLVHPCFLYESLWCLLGFLLLHFYSKKLRSFDGEVGLLFAVWYGAGRMFIEQLRTDSLMLGSIRISQIIAAISAGVALGIFIYFKKKKHILYRDTAESEIERITYERKLILYKEKVQARKALKEAEKDAPSILLEELEGDNKNGENS